MTKCKESLHFWNQFHTRYCMFSHMPETIMFGQSVKFDTCDKVCFYICSQSEVILLKNIKINNMSHQTMPRVSAVIHPLDYLHGVVIDSIVSCTFQTSYTFFFQENPVIYVEKDKTWQLCENEFHTHFHTKNAEGNSREMFFHT